MQNYVSRDSFFFLPQNKLLLNIPVPELTISYRYLWYEECFPLRFFLFFFIIIFCFYLLMKLNCLLSNISRTPKYKSFLTKFQAQLFLKFKRFKCSLDLNQLFETNRKKILWIARATPSADCRVLRNRCWCVSGEASCCSRSDELADRSLLLSNQSQRVMAF